ncbi:hypothetical protein V8G54_014048 [Vigna mungo]|uniref:Uncharacterized protein n=1 Tax=Vigna mungo TaxID=3915 RepID=A0AAQ3NJY8_VIGMU
MKTPNYRIRWYLARRIYFIDEKKREIRENKELHAMEKLHIHSPSCKPQIQMTRSYVTPLIHQFSSVTNYSPGLFFLSFLSHKPNRLAGFWAQITHQIRINLQFLQSVLV